MHLHRKAHHVEPVGWQQLEIVQLLEMRIADLATGAVAWSAVQAQLVSTMIGISGPATSRAAATLSQEIP